MTDPLQPDRNEYSGTYFVQDRQNQREMRRLIVQDQMLTLRMGGVLPEQPDPARFQRVLDVGCGTGGWLMEVAKTYPTIEKLFGADISGKMVTHARNRAKEEGLSGRVEFQTMDALRMLEFAPRSFDLV